MEECNIIYTYCMIRIYIYIHKFIIYIYACMHAHDIPKKHEFAGGNTQD